MSSLPISSSTIILLEKKKKKKKKENVRKGDPKFIRFRVSGKWKITYFPSFSSVECKEGEKENLGEVSSRIFEISPFENSGASLRYELDVYTAAVSPFDLGATPKQ